MVELLEAVCSQLPVDLSQVYIMGSSAGGYAAFRLAELVPRLPAAVLPFAGYYPEMADQDHHVDTLVERLKDVLVMPFHCRSDKLCRVDHPDVGRVYRKLQELRPNCVEWVQESVAKGSQSNYHSSINLVLRDPNKFFKDILRVRRQHSLAAGDVHAYFQGVIQWLTSPSSCSSFPSAPPPPPPGPPPLRGSGMPPGPPPQKGQPPPCTSSRSSPPCKQPGPSPVQGQPPACASRGPPPQPAGPIPSKLGPVPGPPAGLPPQPGPPPHQRMALRRWEQPHRQLQQQLLPQQQFVDAGEWPQQQLQRFVANEDMMPPCAVVTRPSSGWEPGEASEKEALARLNWTRHQQVASQQSPPQAQASHMEIEEIEEC